MSTQQKKTYYSVVILFAVMIVLVTGSVIVDRDIMDIIYLIGLLYYFVKYLYIKNCR